MRDPVLSLVVFLCLILLGHPGPSAAANRPATLATAVEAGAGSSGTAREEAPVGLSTPVSLADPTLNDRIDSWVDWLGSGLSMHKENYLLFPTWSNRAESSEDSELKLQLSIKQQIRNSRFYLAYTQKSFWRVLDQADSRPFRETNHNPEIFYRYIAPPPAWRNLQAWGADLGAEHESNGAREPDSRSWNRLYFTPFVTWGDLRADLKLWYRLSEDVKSDPNDPAGDENPDIQDYLGHGELRLSYLFNNPYLRGSLASLRTRWNLATERGALQLDLSRPTKSKNVYLFAHLFTGYGESLIDYNRSLTRYGIGIMFKR